MKSNKKFIQEQDELLNEIIQMIKNTYKMWNFKFTREE